MSYGLHDTKLVKHESDKLLKRLEYEKLPKNIEEYTDELSKDFPTLPVDYISMLLEEPDNRTKNMEQFNEMLKVVDEMNSGKVKF